MHKRNFTLTSGQCLNDDQYSILAFDVKISEDDSDDPDVLIRLPDPEELDALIGTSKWMVRKATAELLDRASGGGVEIIGPDGVSMEGRSEDTVQSGCGGTDKKLDW